MIGWRELASEFLGTALLLFFGLSAVVMDLSSGAPMESLVSSENLRKLLASVLFATAATLIIYSPLGRISGGHINPAVTLAFAVLGKMTPKSAVSYLLAQFFGAILGTAAVALVWGRRAAGVHVGATLPGPGGIVVALTAEALATLVVICVILTFVERPRFAPFTPAASGLVIAAIVFFASPFYGASMNPARSLGPALVGGVWTGLWVYLVAPSLGALGAVCFHRYRILPCAKLIHDPGYTCRFKNCLYTRRPEFTADEDRDNPLRSSRHYRED
ncbi:aquaporin [Streptomyces sp. NPDC005065]|uniref:MIP/aquaporin family protein n=1 Tax=Streptomyces sp. NPDC005065 TaxID=3154461 RepID=UPI0033A73123